MTHKSYDVTKAQKVTDNERQEEPRRERCSRLAKQVVMVIAVSLAYFAFGAVLTWPSPAVSSLEKDNSTLVGTEIVLSATERDMTGSLVYLGSLLGAWLAGLMVSRIGRRLSLQLLGLPFVLGWILIILAPNTSLLLIGRLIQGFGNGCLIISGYAYIIELSDTGIRGMMANIPNLAIGLGSMYSVVIGYALPWHYLSIVGAIPAVMFIMATLFLPESPSFLVVKGKQQKAMSLLKTLRGNYVDIEAEVEELERRNTTHSEGWKGLANKDILRRIVIVVMTFFFSNMCGNYVILINTARILQNTGAPMDPDAITAITGVLRMAGALLSIFLLDVLGRRYCLLMSHFMHATCMITLATYVYLSEAAAPDDDSFSQFTWIPMVCVMVSLFFCDIGIRPIPFIISSEYFPTNIRTQASSLCVSLGTIMIFAGLQLYNPLLALLTQPGLYWLYGSSSILGVLFALFIIIETKGEFVG